MKKYIEIRALQRDELSDEQMGAVINEFAGQVLRNGTGQLDAKHYFAAIVVVSPQMMRIRFTPKDEEERKVHPYYEVVVPTLDIIRAAAEQCRHRFFTEKHKP
jgi:hypothetical protein